MKFSIATIVLCLLVAMSTGIAQSTVHDIKQFGGAPNADITQVINMHPVFNVSTKKVNVN